MDSDAKTTSNDNQLQLIKLIGVESEEIMRSWVKWKTEKSKGPRIVRNIVSWIAMWNVFLNVCLHVLHACFFRFIFWIHFGYVCCFLLYPNYPVTFFQFKNWGCDKSVDAERDLHPWRVAAVGRCWGAPVWCPLPLGEATEFPNMFCSTSSTKSSLRFWNCNDSCYTNITN